jgi:hypothetical protein
LTAEETFLINPTATINRYDCQSLINWRVDIINGQKLLALAVLKEVYNASEDEFVFEAKDQYRVLRLRSSVYSQQVYRDGMPFDTEVVPRNSSGEPFSVIPIFVVGSENNDKLLTFHHWPILHI